MHKESLNKSNLGPELIPASGALRTVMALDINKAGTRVKTMRKKRSTMPSGMK